LSSATSAPDDYYRGDQNNGITAPDLSKVCTYAEHIVKARGKKSQYSSVSLDKDKIRDFGEVIYRALRDKLATDVHVLVEHTKLISALQDVAKNEIKEERLRAVQALRYATKRKEGVIEWKFDISKVERKDLITWAYARVQPYFQKV